MIGISGRAKRLSTKLFRKAPPAVRRHIVSLACGAFEEASYLRLADKGYLPAAIIDVGAYEGNWTRLTQRVFGPTPALMVEAQSGKRPVLENVCADLQTVQLANVLLGATSEESVTFYEMETGSSFLPEQSNVTRTAQQLTMRRLDDIVTEMLPEPGPVFLKIDVQGAELEVLKGGGETLARADLVQLEVAMLAYNQGAPSFLQVLSYMDERGFVPLEVSGFSRPNGRDLVQIDLLFARRESRLRPAFFSF